MSFFKRSHGSSQMRDYADNAHFAYCTTYSRQIFSVLLNSIIFKPSKIKKDHLLLDSDDICLVVEACITTLQLKDLASSGYS